MGPANRQIRENPCAPPERAAGKGDLAAPSSAILFRIRRPKLDKAKNDGAVALAGAPHRPHAINHSRLDLDKAVTTVALHGPSR
jgi:hypothetical protein